MSINIEKKAIGDILQSRRKGNFTGKRKYGIFNGVFWCLFHFSVYPWTIVFLLPYYTDSKLCLSKKLEIIWAGFIIHYRGNGVLALVPWSLE